MPQGKAFTRAAGPASTPLPLCNGTPSGRPHVSSISSLVHPHDTSQDSDDPEAQSGVSPDDATLLPVTRLPVASRGIVDTRICRSLSSCNVNATPLQEHGHLDSGLRDARQRQRQLRSHVPGSLKNHLLPFPASPSSLHRRAHRGISASGLRLINLTAGHLGWSIRGIL